MFSTHDGTTIVPFPRQRRGVMFVTKDPPEYTTIRRLISAGFTPRMIGRLEERIRRHTEWILDDAAATGELDFVPEIALFTFAHELSAAKRANPTDDVWSILANSEL